MVLTLQNRYIVLTGDLKSSRELKDRAKVQQKLKNALTDINKKFKEAIVAEFMVVRGDSFQGMLYTPKYIFDIYHALFEDISHQFYLGIGVGGIATSLSENIGEIDGEAFHKASEALEMAKREKIWIVFKSEWEFDEVVTHLLNFMADVMWNWTKRQREIVMCYKKVKDKKRDATLEEIAKNIGIKNAELSFADFISQKWLTREGHRNELRFQNCRDYFCC